MPLTASELHRIAVHEALAVLGDAYSRPPDAATADLWTEALAAYTAEVVTSSARAWIASETRFPSVAAFVESCLGESQRRAAQARAKRTEHRPDPEGMARCRRGFALARVALAEGDSSEEFMARLDEAGVLTGDTDSAPTVACVECMDARALWRDDGSVRPCSRCEGLAYERWYDHYRHRGHSCEECRPGRRAA